MAAKSSSHGHWKRTTVAIIAMSGMNRVSQVTTTKFSCWFSWT